MKKMSYVRKELLQKLESLEKRTKNHDENVHTLFESIRKLINSPKPSKYRIGFVQDE